MVTNELITPNCTVDKEPQSDLMELIAFREGEGLAYKAGQAPTECVVPALDVGGLTRFLIERVMGLSGQGFQGGNFSISRGTPYGTAARCRMRSGSGGIACVWEIRSVR
jgi:hypothetical protein